MPGIFLAAWYDVRTRPLRTLAAIAGMVAAVASLVVIDAAGVLSRQGSDDYVRRAFGQPATVEITTTGSLTGRQQAAAQTGLPRALREDGISTVSRYQKVRGIAIGNDHLVSADAAVVDASYAQVRIVDLVAGVFPSQSGDRGALRGVVDEETARQLGWEPRQIVGRRLEFGQTGLAANPDPRTTPTTPVVIDAVMRSNRADDSAPALLLVGHPSWSTETQPSWLARVAPTDVAYLKEVTASIGESDFGSSGFFLATRLDQDETLAPVIAQQTRTAGIVAWIAMAVGGLGMVGVGLASIRERARELGVRRALGATRSSIFLGVVVETLLQVFAALALALPLAGLVVALLPSHLVVADVPVPPNATLPFSSALRGTLAAALVGLLAGLAPAARAARASVIGAIRG